MRKLISIVGGLLVSALVGCVPCLQPLYTESDLVYEPALVGSWADESDDVWTFSKSGDMAYKLMTLDGGKKGEFVARLLQVDGRRFLDLYPEDPGLEQNGFYQAHLVPVHTFIRVDEVGATLRMAMMNPDWLKKFLLENPDDIRHEKVGDRIVLSAQPKEMQAFIIKHEKTPDAWGDAAVLTRMDAKPDGVVEQTGEAVR